jgi:Ca2+-binding RTX toxin-like protein
MQRRGVLLLTSIVVMVVVGAGVALAANIDCGDFGKPGGNCLGTNQPDVIDGTSERDFITAASGADTVNARNDRDEVYGDRHGDTLRGQAGDDYVEGGRGLDELRGGNQNDVLNAVDQQGGDTLNGGDGDDDCLIDEDNLPAGSESDVTTNCEEIWELR